MHKTHTGLQTASCILSTLAGAFRGSTRAAPQLAMNVHAIGQRAQDGLCLSSMEKHGFKLRSFAWGASFRACSSQVCSIVTAASLKCLGCN